jgi:uncharacterized repeat protein (TIGR01451 family)
VGLALVKQARALDGTVLPDQALVAPGQEIYFLLYVDNPTNVAAGDVRISDVLDETQFAYVPGTLEQNFVASGASDAVIWTGSWSALTDAAGAGYRRRRRTRPHHPGQRERTEQSATEHSSTSSDRVAVPREGALTWRT